MDLESLPPPNDLVKCCSCGCSCSFINKSSGIWVRSVKRKFDEIDECSHFVPLANLDYSSVARVEIENECVALREALSRQQQSIQELYGELEEERNASASAASEAMSMILRLQREKAVIQMEARQFKRFAEEKMAHDQQEIIVLEDVLYKREQAIQSLTCEVHAYKHRMLSYGLTEAEAEAEGEKGGHSRNHSMENFEFPPYDYPPLKCNLNETQDPPDHENDVTDIEKYPFGETPQSREHLQNLGHRIYQLERNPSSNQIDGEFSGTKNILEKAVVGQSPRRYRHIRRFSTDSSGSFFGLVKETGHDCPAETPRPTGSFKKAEYFSHNEDYSNLRKVDNASDLGDDMSDRIYTIDSVHNGLPYNGVTEQKCPIGICEDYVTTPRGSLNQTDVGDPDIKKLYVRLQALEADRESMRQAIVSMRTDKAQLILLREIAERLCKEMSPERRMPVKKTSLMGGFSFMSMMKWIVSVVFWRKKARRSKYMFGISANNMGLLMLLDKGSYMSRWRCLTRAQVRNYMQTSS